jgi:hypothetical protein
MFTSEEIARWRAGLDALHACIAGRFRRVEVRECAKRYLTHCFACWANRLPDMKSRKSASLRKSNPSSVR